MQNKIIKKFNELDPTLPKEQKLAELKRIIKEVEEPETIIVKEIEKVESKLENIIDSLSGIKDKEVKTYEAELQNLLTGIENLKNELVSKDMVVNIPLDNLSKSINEVEKAVSNIKIPEVKIPETIFVENSLDLEIVEAINNIPEFPIKEISKMLSSLEEKVSLIKLELPEFDYQRIEEGLDKIVKAIKKIDLTVYGGGGGIGDRANNNLDSIKVAVETKLDTQKEILLQIANFLASINSTRGIAADLRTTVLSLPTLPTVTTLSNQTSLGGYTASAMVQNSQNSVAVLSNINNIASN